MTRRNRSRLPQKLPDPARERAPRDAKAPSPRERLKHARVAGRSARFSREEVHSVMRRLVSGSPTVHLGLPRFDRLTLAHVEMAMTSVFGWNGDGPRARIAPSHTVTGFTAASERVLEVARSGGRLVFATSRPASLFPLHRALAAAAHEAGGQVLQAEEVGPINHRGERIWWLDRVAMISDGKSLLGESTVQAADELLFALPRPDLVVADRGFAGVALASGLEVVAFADVDAVALAVAAWRGRAIRLVPLDEHRPPAAYAPLLEILDDIVGTASVDMSVTGIDQRADLRFGDTARQ
jgi:hypothetical protein